MPQTWSCTQSILHVLYFGSFPHLVHSMITHRPYIFRWDMEPFIFSNALATLSGPFNISHLFLLLFFLALVVVLVLSFLFLTSTPRFRFQTSRKRLFVLFCPPLDKRWCHIKSIPILECINLKFYSLN